MIIIKDLLRKLEVSRAVAFNVLLQAWSVLAGPMTLLVIATQLSPDEQGYYYTFNSLLALQIFIDLGLTTVIVQFASHEWANLGVDERRRISGDSRSLSRLASLAHLALIWYGVGALILMGVLGISGYLFFSQNSHPGIVWEAPWFALCMTTGIVLFLSPVLSLLEGCNQVTEIYGYRLVNGILSSVAIWVSMALGAGLFSLAIATAVRLLWSAVFLLWRYRRFLAQILFYSIQERVEWRSEMLPFQARIAVSWISGYFIFQLFNPVMFHYHGAATAGQMGMTLALVNLVPSLAFSWVQTRAPRFGILIARRDYKSLDRLLLRLTIISTGIVGLGSASLLVGLAWLQSSGLAIEQRFLPLLPTFLLLLTYDLNLMVNIMAVYLRAHKKEPLMWTSVSGAVLVGISAWLLGARFGPTGVAFGNLSIALLYGLPINFVIWQRCRVAWHMLPAGISDESGSDLRGAAPGIRGNLEIWNGH